MGVAEEQCLYKEIVAALEYSEDYGVNSEGSENKKSASDHIRCEGNIVVVPYTRTGKFQKFISEKSPIEYLTELSNKSFLDNIKNYLEREVEAIYTIYDDKLQIRYKDEVENVFNDVIYLGLFPSGRL